jgi:hypothetical protein
MFDGGREKLNARRPFPSSPSHFAHVPKRIMICGCFHKVASKFICYYGHAMIMHADIFIKSRQESDGFVVRTHKLLSFSFGSVAKRN